MQKDYVSPHSKNSLFLMEMILSLLFLALVCSACVQIFAAARSSRQQARQWNHIQELTITTGEILEGSPAPFEKQEQPYRLFFDRSWNPVSEAEAYYTYTLTLIPKEKEKAGRLVFTGHNQEELYAVDFRFPIFSDPQEVQP